MKFALVAALLMAGQAHAETAPRFDVDALKRMTEKLSSDAFEGRAPMTPAERKTIDFIAARFASAGLKPGNNGSWFQEVPLVSQTVDAARADLAFTRAGTLVQTAKYGSDAVVWSKRVEPHVALEASELVFVGHGIVAPELGWNDYAGLDMRGKTAVILVNDPDWQRTDLEGPFKGRAMTYYGRWDYKYAEAARQGAAGAVIVHDTEPAGYGWRTVELSWTGPQIDMDGRSSPRVAVEGWMQKPVAEALMKAAGMDLVDLSQKAKDSSFKAVPLGIEVSVELHNSIRREKSNNVIGLLEGSERPGEVIVHTAHWDHLGRCGADASGDDICNGALDNATGTAGIIELARAHAAAGPAKRSLLFVAVTAEESGLLGSDYFAQNPVFPLSKTVAGFNLDGLNIIGPTHDITVVGWGKSELEDLLRADAEAHGKRLERETTPEKGFYYRSDHFSLSKRGVPTLAAGSGVDVIGKGKAWGQAQADDYTEKRYHQQGDEYDPNWNWDGAIEELSMTYRLARKLANSDQWPNWYEGDEFRAIRDASRAAAE